MAALGGGRAVLNSPNHVPISSSGLERLSVFQQFSFAEQEPLDGT